MSRAAGYYSRLTYPPLESSWKHLCSTDSTGRSWIWIWLWNCTSCRTSETGPVPNYSAQPVSQSTCILHCIIVNDLNALIHAPHSNSTKVYACGKVPFMIRRWQRRIEHKRSNFSFWDNHIYLWLWISRPFSGCMSSTVLSNLLQYLLHHLIENLDHSEQLRFLTASG